MTTTPTPTSGAAIQRYKIGYRACTPCGIPDASGSWVRYADHVTALAAGQATAAQQGVAYAELPDGVATLCEYGGDVFTAAQMRAFADATHTLRASHVQAPSQAGEYPALVCDYCGALTPDPWHSSGMLHGKMSKHIHSCDACVSRGQAPALTNLNCKSEQKRLATLWGFVPAQAASVQEDAARAAQKEGS